ncbi:hypothetical protein ABVT39_018976 [Epinephelus coioides]
MLIVSVAYFLLLGSDATVVRNVNTTVSKSVVLPCILMTPAPVGLNNLRFYWQDEGKYVLYSFNKGEEKPAHVKELYQARVTAFPQEMIRGNISVKLRNITLEDNQKVFQAFAPVSDSRRKPSVTPICQITLHVAVPYESARLTVNKEKMTAVCTTQRGFPKPWVEWRLHYLSDKSQHLVDQRDINTTAVQDPRDHLYSLRSTIHIPGDQYQSMTCLIYNPTQNETLITTHDLNKGEAEKSLPDWATALIVTVAVVLSLCCSCVAHHTYWRTRQSSSSPDCNDL